MTIFPVFFTVGVSLNGCKENCLYFISIALWMTRSRVFWGISGWLFNALDTVFLDKFMSSAISWIVIFIVMSTLLYINPFLFNRIPHECANVNKTKELIVQKL